MIPDSSCVIIGIEFGVGKISAIFSKVNRVICRISDELLSVLHYGDRFMFGKVINFLKDEDGQTSTEYILLVAVVALIVFKFKNTAQTKLTELTEGVFTTANDKILEEMQNN